MKYDHKGENAAQGGDGAMAPAPAGGSERVQLKQALQGKSYAQQVQMVRATRPTHERANTEVDSPEQTEGEPGAKPKTAEVTLSAKSGGSPFSSEFWQDLDVGHCWVDIRKPDGRKDSWGYTAKDVRNFPTSRPWKTVGGRVLHPDGSRGATGTLTEAIDEDQLAKGERWAESRSDKYNLFGLNGGNSCATFAQGFYEEASGKKAPTGALGALVANPNSLSAAMNKKLERERKKNPEATPSDEETDPGGGETEG